MTQSERIIRHLKDHHSITAVEAMQEYGIMRLAARISDIRKQGYHVDRRMISRRNRYGEMTSFAQYYMEE